MLFFAAGCAHNRHSIYEKRIGYSISVGYLPEWGRYPESHNNLFGVFAHAVMAQVLIRMGDIFEASAHLTVLPCSAKGTISSATARWKQAFGISTPTELGLTLQLGGTSQVFPFPGPSSVSKNFCYAASVLNDYSSAEVIERIGAEIGRITSAREDIRIVESPLLGTGAGGLSTDVAGRSLAKGYATTAHPDATLFIFVYDRERFQKLEATLSEQPGISHRVWNAVGMRPGMFGLSIDIKKLLGR